MRRASERHVLLDTGGSDSRTSFGPAARSCRLLGLPARWGRSIVGCCVEFGVNLTKRPLVFRDWAGDRYWQYPGDEIASSWRRGAVGDSVGVVKFIRRYVRRGWTCIDIGARIGSVSVPLWRRVGPEGKVVSIEPHPRSVRRLRANLRLNSLPDAYVLSAAVTDREDVASLRCFPEADGWHTLGRIPAIAEGMESFLIEVPTVDFPLVADRYAFEACDLVKIDVEGAEPLVLGSMRAHLAERRIGCVVFEVNPYFLPALGFAVGDLEEFWRDLGYDVRELNPDGSVSDIGGWESRAVRDFVALAGGSRPSRPLMR